MLLAAGMLAAAVSVLQVDALEKADVAMLNCFLTGAEGGQGAGDLNVFCQIAEEKQSDILKIGQAKIQKREVVVVWANIEPAPEKPKKKKKAKQKQEQEQEQEQEPLNPYGKIAVSEQDYEALCRIVQAEAGGEDELGKILVAQVVLNRTLSENFASNVSDVIFERSGGKPQFTPTADGRFYSVEVSEETVEAVEKALHGEDRSQGALFFSARKMADPSEMEWFDSRLRWLFQHGGHEFYTLP